jgi:hypothetical protein
LTVAAVIAAVVVAASLIDEYADLVATVASDFWDAARKR